MNAKRCIELIRVSTAGQAREDRASIPAQQTINRRTAAAHGLQIVQTIQINDVSGANVLRSPEMQDLLSLIQDPNIVGVVCREFSRLMRPDNYEDLALLQRFVDSKTSIYLPDGRVDPSDLLLTMVRAGVAGRERKEMLERAWASKEEKRQRGELAQSKICLPWGVEYELREGKPVWSYKPIEAEKVRWAYRQVLRGKTNYSRIAEKLGVTPRGAALILRNPIWKGWRIIDKKRDASSTGKYSRDDGKQADRRKIQRSPDEVRKIHVIKHPLVTEADWERAQQLMQQKQALHWRNRKDSTPRFTYSGFLTCAQCGQPVHSVLARRDYYVCRASRMKPHTCNAAYMSRERLEKALDKLFSQQLTKPRFVARCVASLRRQQKTDSEARRVPQLQQSVERLRKRKSQVIDVYLEGVIDRDERDKRLASIDRDLEAAQTALLEAAEQVPQSGMTPEQLVQTLAPLGEWPYWTYEQKRATLALLAPDIKVADCRVKAVGLTAGRSSSDTRYPAASTTTAPATASAPRP